MIDGASVLLLKYILWWSFRLFKNILDCPRDHENSLNNVATSNLLLHCCECKQKCASLFQQMSVICKHTDQTSESWLKAIGKGRPTCMRKPHYCRAANLHTCRQCFKMCNMFSRKKCWSNDLSIWFLVEIGINMYVGNRTVESLTSGVCFVCHPCFMMESNYLPKLLFLVFCASLKRKPAAKTKSQ